MGKRSISTATDYVAVVIMDEKKKGTKDLHDIYSRNNKETLLQHLGMET